MLVVVKAFHLDGVMKSVGDALSGAEEKKILDMLEHDAAEVSGQAREWMKNLVRRAESEVAAEVAKVEAAVFRKSPAPSDAPQA